MAWNTKGSRGPPFSILGSFYMQKVLMALQQTQVTFISRHAIIVSEGSSNLSVLSSDPLLFLSDIFFAPGGFEYLTCSRSFCGPPPLVVFFFCQDLGPIILYLFSPLFWMFCFINVWKVFIINVIGWANCDLKQWKTFVDEHGWEMKTLILDGW